MPRKSDHDLRAQLSLLSDLKAETRRVEALVHRIAGLPGLELEAHLRVLTETLSEPQHLQRLARALHNLKARIDDLINMVEEKKPV